MIAKVQIKSTYTPLESVLQYVEKLAIVSWYHARLLANNFSTTSRF